MGLVEHQQLEFRQKFVPVRLPGNFRSQCLDSRDYDVSVGGGQRSGLAAPHPRYPQLRPLDSLAGPYFPPRFHRLLTQLVSVSDPQNASVKAVIPHSFNNRLHSDASFAGPGRHADHPTTVSYGVADPDQISDSVYDPALVFVKIRE